MTLALFGGPEVMSGDEIVHLTPYQAALLGLLAGDEEQVTRSRLIRLLWGESCNARTRHRLSQLIYGLARTTPFSNALSRTNEVVVLKRTAVSLDLLEFSETLDQGDLANALRLAEKGFLSRLSDFPSEAYEDWVGRRRMTLRAKLRDLAMDQLRRGEVQAEWSTAIGAAQALLRLHPTNEAFLQQLMRAMIMAGFPEGAESAFIEFKESFQVHLGRTWHPHSGTTTLMDRIQAALDSPSRVSASGIVTKPRTALDFTFVGREKEVAGLWELLQTPRSQGTQIVLIQGEAGIGKTRLIDELLKRCALLNLHVLSGRSAEFERSIPLNPMLEALTPDWVGDKLESLERPWQSVLLPLLPAHHRSEGPLPQPPNIQPRAIPRRLFEAFRRLFQEIVKEKPLVLFLDDCHWIDETSLSVLEYVRRRWCQSGLFIILAARPQTPDSPTTLRRFLHELKASGVLEELELRELSPGAAGQLSQEVADRHLTQEEVAELVKLGGRNPFFTIELTLEHMAGRVVPGRKIGQEIRIPTPIRQLLDNRLRILTVKAQRILEVLAVFDDPMDVEVIKDLTLTPVDECLRAIEQLEDHRLVTVTLSGVHVRHELIRRTAYEKLSNSRVQWLHRRISQLLMQLDPIPVSKLALHLDRAGEREFALQFALQAAERAEESGAVPEAIRYLEIGARNADDPVRLAGIIGRVGHLYYLHQDFQRAAAALDDAATRLRGQGRLHEALLAEMERLDSLWQMQEISVVKCGQGLKRVRAEAVEVQDWAVLAKALDFEAHLHDRTGNREQVLAVLRAAEECARKEDPQARITALHTLALNIYYGDPLLALRSARKAVDQAKARGLESIKLRALNRLLIVLMHQGLLESTEGQALQSEIVRGASEGGDILTRFNLYLNLGVWLLDTGHYDRALRSFEAAREILRDSPARTLRGILLHNIGEAHYWKRDIQLARLNFQEARHHLGPETAAYAQNLAAAGLGLCDLFEGKLAAARSRYQSLPSPPHSWYFDPSLLIIFQAGILVRRSSPSAALELLLTTAQDIRGRYVQSWVKLVVEAGRISSRYSLRKLDPLLEEALSTCCELNLNVREGQLRGLLG